jgi:hypothetical protein
MCNVVKGLRRFSGIAKLCIALALTAASAHAQAFSIANLSANTTSNTSHPTMVSDAKGNINMAWIDSVKGIMFARSADGKNFPAPVAVQAQAPPPVVPAFPPQMAVYPTQTNVIEIVWAAPDPTSTQAAPLYDVFAARSDDSGAHFTTSLNISGPVALAGSPRMAFDFSGKANVVWGRTGVWISQSQDGKNFGVPISLVPPAVPTVPPTPPPALDTGGPRVIADNANNIFVAWTDEASKNAAGSYCTSTEPPPGTPVPNTLGGNVFVNEKLASAAFSAAATHNLSKESWKGVDAKFPNGFFGCSYDNLSLITDRVGLVHLVWSDDSPIEDILTSQVETVTNADGTYTFSFPFNLAGQSAASPKVVTDANSIYVVWSGGPGGPASSEGIFLSRSDDRAQTFTPTVNVAPHGAIAPAYPQVAVDAKGNVSVAWEQPHKAIAADGTDTFDVFLARSADKGATFPATSQVSTNSSVLCIPTGAPPATPETTTCGTVQLGLDVNASPVMAWVNKPSATAVANIDFATVLPPVFSITLGPASANVLAGGTATYNVQVTPGNGFAGTVNLSCSGLPTGASCTLNPAATSTTSTLTVTTQGTTAAGTSQVTVTGTSPNTTPASKSATFIVGTITAAVSANSATIAVGSSANFTLNLSSSNGFTGNVNLTCPGVPTGISCTFSPQSTAVPGSTTLTVSVGTKPTGSLIQNGPRGLDGLFGLQRNTVFSMVFGALALILCGMIAASRRQKPLPLARGLAVMALVMVLAVGLISCGGSTSTTSSGGGTGGGGTGGQATPFNGQVVVQAQSGGATTNLSTLSITVP